MREKQVQRQARINLASMAMAQHQRSETMEHGAIEGPKKSEISVRTESQSGSKKVKAPMKQRGALPAVPSKKQGSKPQGNAVSNQTNQTKGEVVIEKEQRLEPTSTPPLQASLHPAPLLHPTLTCPGSWNQRMI